MKISVIHPSRSRPDMAKKTAHKWLSSAKDRGDIEYILSVDSTDPTLDRYDFANELGLLLHIGDNKTAIEAINSSARLAMGNFYPPDLLIVVSDDFSCPYHWDEMLRERLHDKSDYLVKTIDGGQPWIITLPIMDRVYYQRFGYVYHPNYLHLFCDTEFTHVGHMLGKVIELDIKFPHDHYTTGKMAKDAINVKNDATWSQGESVYLSRLYDNFDLPIDQIVNGADYCHISHLQWLKSKGVSFK